MSAPSAPRPALTPEREKELLGLIEAYAKLIGWERSKIVGKMVRILCSGDVPRRLIGVRGFHIPASWAESEACLREVAGECAVRKIEIIWEGPDSDGDERCFLDGEPVSHGAFNGFDKIRPVALLKAFVSAFGSEPRHE